MLNDIIQKFTDSHEYEKLSGGQNSSLKVGEIVIKPITDIERYIWIANEIESLASPSIMIAKPIRSKNGNWIENGYGASQYITGKYYDHKIREKIKAANLFHKVVANIEKPSKFDLWESPWSLSSRVAWEEIELPQSFYSHGRKVIATLLKQYKNITFETQLIHSDLASNFLFNSGKPIVIDISPDFRPVEYANTLLVTESIAWRNESLESLNHLKFPSLLRKQLILRAIVFRLCVPLFFNNKDSISFSKELNNYINILDIEQINY